MSDIIHYCLVEKRNKKSQKTIIHQWTLVGIEINPDKQDLPERFPPLLAQILTVWL